MTETIDLIGTDDVFERARKILRVCGLSGADQLTGIIAEVLHKYEILDGRKHAMSTAAQASASASPPQTPPSPPCPAGEGAGPPASHEE